MLPVAAVKFDAANENDHPDEQIEALKLSLEIFGQQKPILVDKKKVCVAGEGVLRAVIALGWKEVECELCPLEGPARDGYRLADNTTAWLGEWDVRITQANMKGLDKALGPNFKWEAIGLTKEEVRALKSGTFLAASSGGSDAVTDKPFLTIKIMGVKMRDRKKVMRAVNGVLKSTDYKANAY